MNNNKQYSADDKRSSDNSNDTNRAARDTERNVSQNKNVNQQQQEAQGLDTPTSNAENYSNDVDQVNNAAARERVNKIEDEAKKSNDDVREEDKKINEQRTANQKLKEQQQRENEETQRQSRL